MPATPANHLDNPEGQAGGGNGDASDLRSGASAEHPSSSEPVPARQPERPILPEISSDEADIGWGDRDSRYSDDWYESERPPHHG